MPIRNVLIVAKKSAYQTYFDEYQKRPLRELARKGDKALLGIRRSHNTHYETLAHVRKVLKKQNIPAEVSFRGEPFNPKKYDFVITVGGDGSFLEASHRVGHKLILGVNSDKSHSVGQLCTADSANFERFFSRILRGDFRTVRLNRMKITFNNKPLAFPVLNDVLVSHLCPAAMSHYLLRIGGRTERQRSSGVWISTAAGSTAAVHSAGGRVLPRSSASLQYRTREPFEGHGEHYRLTGGVLSKGRGITLVSQMQEGMLYLDGAHHSMPFRYGDKIVISGGPPLNTVSF